MILQIAWSLTFFAGLCLTVSNCFPASPWRVPLRRILLIAASAGIFLAAGFAFLLLVNGRPFEHTGPWALPIGSFALRIGIPEALMLLFVNLMGGVILASLWSEVSELDLGALLILLPALGVCLAARDAVLFLMAWEIMALSGVIWQRGRSTPEDRYDGHGLWAYLASAHLATACLLVALPLLAKLGGSQAELGGPVLWDGQFSKVAGPGTAWALVGLVLAGFGTKAGMFPFHVWIRTVYRNAPARFGAVSSGLMAKVSLFLLIRTMIRIMPLIGPDRTPWVAGLLMMLGMATGLAGLAGALTSARIKVMLGYSSMENVGIILVGFGLGVWGMTREAWTVATFAMVGVWFHMLNHMIAKTCLFLAARNVIRQTHTDDVARLGGLHKRMPVTALAFGAGGLALSAMVPLNAFNSELMIFDGLFRGVLDLGPAGRDLSILAAAVLGLMGGLAAVCFTGLWGLGFLGNPRTPAAEQADEQGISWQNMTVLKLLTFCIVLLGVVPILGYGTVRGAVVDQLKSMGCGESALALAESEVVSLTIWMSIVAVFLFVMILALKRWRDSRLEKATIDSGLTWDCGFGYTDTFPRGQYGPLSYFDPAGNFVSKWTWQKVHRPDLSEPFPPRRRIRIESADGLFYYLYDPVFRFVGKYLSRLRWIQAGSIQLYLAMMALTLVAMLAWVAAL